MAERAKKVGKKAATRARAKKPTVKRPPSKETVARDTASKEASAKEAPPRKSDAKGAQGTKARAAKHTSTKRETSKADGAEPKLLTGGNPQIPKGDGDAPVQAYIAAMPDWKKKVGRYLDALTTRTVPGVRKAVRWNTPFYGIEDNGWFLGFHCFNKYVKVTFLRGTGLRPLPPGSSKYPEVRYLDIHEDEELDEALLMSWIKQAAAQPGDPLF